MTGSRRSIRVPRRPRSHGPGKKALPLSGLQLLTRDLPSVANLFLLTSLSAQTQRKRVFHGEILESSMLIRTISIQVTRSFHVQLRREISYLQSSRKPTSSGLSIASISITRLTRIREVYCSYCDMNNHPRFTCKHVKKHHLPFEKHHCTLCAAKHPPFLCPRAQVNGGLAQPNWYKAEYKRAKQENRDADYRWGPMVTHVDVDGPDSTSQHPSEAPQPVCAAAAMMHGMSMAPASSVHGGCPSIAEHQEFAPCMPPPAMTMMQRDVITPNPGYKIPANLWDLNIAHCAHAPSPLATFIRHCNAMESPYSPTYSKQGVSVPADSMTCTKSSRYLHSSVISITALHLSRISKSCRSIARSLRMSLHVVVYGQTESRHTLQMSRRKSTHGLQV